MRRAFSHGDLRQSRAVLLLTVDWAGQEYRFSSEPLTITGDDGTVRNFGGGLNVSQITTELDRETISADDLSIPLELLFPVDAVARVRQGNPLSAATGEFSVALVRREQGLGLLSALHSWEDRARLFRGAVSEAITGDPRFTPRRVAFSLDALPADDQRSILDGRTVITNTRITSSNNKLPPFVFGKPGVYIDADGNQQAVPGSPAYEVTGLDGSAGNLRQASACVGVISSDRVTLIDDTGASVVRSTSLVNRDGGYLTVAQELLGATTWDNPPVWVAWTDATAPIATGAILDPYTSKPLTRLGNLIRVLIQRAGGEADHGAWSAAAGWLNRYEMAGYISDSDTTVWSFLSQHILPIIPALAVVQDVDGLRPILHGTDRPIASLEAVTTGPGFLLASGEGETRTPSEVVNDLTLEYAFDAKEEKPMRSLRVGPQGVIGVDLVSPVATASALTYGHKLGTTIQSWYIYDDAAARRILTDLVAWQAFIPTEITIDAAPQWGRLDLGDEIALTCPELQITSRRAVVVGRGWQVLTGLWSLTLWIAPDPLANPPEV